MEQTTHLVHGMLEMDLSVDKLLYYGPEHSEYLGLWDEPKCANINTDLQNNLPLKTICTLFFSESLNSNYY